MQAAINQFEAWAASSERSLAQFLHPALDYDARATKGWFLTRLDHALYVLGIYLVMVLFGLIMRFTQRKSEKAEQKQSNEAPKLAIELFKAQPIRYLGVLYNSVQVSLCGWMIVAALFEAIQQGAPPVCGPFDASSTRIAKVEWVFYLSKVLDFFDTFFIIARGEWRQLNFLHIYHHASIFMTYWMLTVVAYDGDIYYTIVANSFVHLVMYYYYLLSLFGIKPSWGKNVTQLQMFQFVTMNLQAIYILYAGCAYPKNVTVFYLAYIISLFALFANFYNNRWAGGKSKKSTSAAKTASKDD